MLDKEAIIKNKLIRNYHEENFRDISYDLSANSVYDPESRQIIDLTQDYILPPQGMIILFSRERVCVPSNYCGFAEPKTNLCDRGILILNTGIVDPNYDGYVSGTAVNFSSQKQIIKPGEKFLRLVFHQVSSDENSKTPTSTETFDQYRNKKIVSAQGYPSTFLNIPDTVKAIGKALMEEERNFVNRTLLLTGAGIAIIGLVLTLSVGAMQIAPSFIEKHTIDQNMIQDYKKLKKENERLEKILEEQKSLMSKPK